MRILYLLHQYLPEFVGGSELYTQGVARAVAARGHTAGLFYRSYQPAQGLHVTADGAVRLYVATAGPLAPARRFLDTFGQPALAAAWSRTLDDFRPDLVHVSHLMGLPAALVWEVQRRRIPYLITFHDYWWICANANLLTNYAASVCAGPHYYLNCTRCVVARSGRAAAWATAPVLPGTLALRNRLLGALLRDAHLLLAPSDFVRNWYVSHGIPADQIRTLRLGIVLPDEGLPARTPPGQTLRLLYLGGIAPNKGVHVLLAALQGVHGPWELLVAGDDSTHPDYARDLRQLATGQVRFVGKLDRTQVWQALRAADVVLVPSLSHETFCFVVHEAMAAGTPVVAAAMGALSEAVAHEVNGLLLPPGDLPAWRAALQRLVDAPQILEQYRAQLAPPLGFAAHVEALDAIYAAMTPAAVPGLDPLTADVRSN